MGTLGIRHQSQVSGKHSPVHSQTLGNCPDRSGQPKVLDAAGGARTTIASAQVGQPRAGTPCPRGLLLPTERAHVTSPSVRSRLSYPAGGSSRGPARPRARPAGRPAARSRRPACFLLRRAAGRLGSPDLGRRPKEGDRGGDDWGPENCSRPPWAPHSAPTVSERSAWRGSARCRRDFPLARDAEQRAVLATAKHLRNRCRSSSWQPQLAVTKAGLDGATARRSGPLEGVTSCSHATPEPSRRGTPTRAPPQLVTLSAGEIAPGV